MNKDKDWAQEQVNFYKECVGEPWNGYTRGLNVGYRTAETIISQLDEPEKPVVPQFVADWYEENKNCIEIGLWNVMYNFVHEISQIELEDELKGWFDNLRNNPFQTVMLMNMNGYTVSKEKRYRLRL